MSADFGIANLAEGDLLIDVPLFESREKTQGRGGGEVRVYDYWTEENWELSEASAVVKAAKTEFAQLTMRARLFLSRRTSQDLLDSDLKRLRTWSRERLVSWLKNEGFL